MNFNVETSWILHCSLEGSAIPEVSKVWVQGLCIIMEDVDPMNCRHDVLICMFT